MEYCSGGSCSDLVSKRSRDTVAISGERAFNAKSSLDCGNMQICNERQNKKGEPADLWAKEEY
jgi:hypothetical protein